MNPSPEVFLEELCKGADPRKERSLKLIYTICTEQHERGSKDFSVATIGRLSSERGGPSAGAIRNKTGEAYRAIIKAFADSVGGINRKVAPVEPSAVDQILEGVTDPVLRTRISLMLAEIESLRAQLLAARHLAAQNAVVNLADYHGPKQENPVCELGQVEVLSPCPEFTSLEIRALRGAISDKTFTHWGWHAEENGRIRTETGQVVFGAGFITAIRKILEGIDQTD